MYLYACMYTWLVPVRFPSLNSWVSMSLVSLFCFSSLNSNFMGTTCDFWTGWIGCFGGRSFFSSASELKCVTRNSITYAVAHSCRMMPSLSLGRKSLTERDIRLRWGWLSDQLNSKSGKFWMAMARRAVALSILEWRSESGTCNMHDIVWWYYFAIKINILVYLHVHAWPVGSDWNYRRPIANTLPWLLLDTWLQL